MSFLSSLLYRTFDERAISSELFFEMLVEAEASQKERSLLSQLLLGPLSVLKHRLVKGSKETALLKGRDCSCKLLSEGEADLNVDLVDLGPNFQELFD